MITKYGLVKNDFGQYTKFYNQFQEKKVNEDSVEYLELRKQKATKLPSSKILSIFRNLKNIDLSFNNLNEMRMKEFANAVPNLEVLNLDYNRIMSLIDIENLGELKHLKELTFLNNPVSTSHQYMQILEELMFPPSQKKQCPVEILTATYKFVPNYPETKQKIEVNQHTLQFVEELKDTGFLKYTPISEQQHPSYILQKKEKNWLVVLKEKPCPTRKIGAFKTLQKLNDSMIKIGHIFDITSLHRTDQIVRNEIEEKTKEKIKKINELVAENEKVTYNKKPNKKLQENYIKRHVRKLRRKEDEYEPILYLDEAQGKNQETYLQVIFKIDQINNQREKDRKNWYNHLDLWDRPAFQKSQGADNIYSIKDVKKEGDRLDQKRIKKEQKQKEAEEKYKQLLRKAYGTKQKRWLSEDRNFFKFCGGVDVDPSILEKYEKDLITKQSRRKNNYKIKLRLEERIDEYESSENDLESNSSIGSEDDEFFKLTMNRGQTNLQPQHSETFDFSENSRTANENSSKFKNVGKKLNNLKNMNGNRDIKDDEINEGVESEEDSFLKDQASEVKNEQAEKKNIILKGESLRNELKIKNQLYQKYFVEEVPIGGKETQHKKETSINKKNKNVHPNHSRNDSNESIVHNSRFKGIEVQSIVRNQKSNFNQSNNLLNTHSNNVYLNSDISRESLPFSPTFSSKGTLNQFRGNFGDLVSQPQEKNNLTENQKVGSENDELINSSYLDLVEKQKLTKFAFDDYLKEQELKRKKMSVILTKSEKQKLPKSSQISKPSALGSTRTKLDEYEPPAKKDRRDIILTRPRSQYISRQKIKIKHSKEYQIDPGEKILNEKRKENKIRRAQSQAIIKKHHAVVMKNRQVDYTVFSKPSVTDAERKRPQTQWTKQNVNKNYHKFAKINNKKIIIKPGEPEWLSPQDININDEDILPGNEEGFDELLRLQLKKDDQRNENNLEMCKKILKDSTLAIKNFQALDATIEIPDVERWHSKASRRVIPRQIVFRLMNEIFPTKMDTNGIQRKADYSRADALEFQRIYDGVNDFIEAPEFDLKAVKFVLNDPDLGHERRKFLNDVLSLYELSRMRKVSNNQVLWKKEIQKEFEKKQQEAVLAMHYLKLKDYYPDQNLERYAEKLMKSKGGRANLDVLKTKVKTDKELILERQIEEKVKKEIDAMLPPNYYKRLPQEEFKQAMKQKIVKREYPDPPPLNISEKTERDFPGITYKLNAMKFKRRPLYSFEQAFDNAQNKSLALQNLNKGSNKEEMLMNYAKNYKKEAKQAQELVLSVKNEIIPDIERKMKQFYKDIKEMDAQRYDDDYCMRVYVKKTIDGEIEFQINYFQFQFTLACNSSLSLSWLGGIPF